MKHLGIYLAVIVFVIQLFLLPRVGMSWDEPSSFFVGRANLNFWMTGNREYLNKLEDKTLFKDSPFPYIFGEDIYPPFQFVLSSATSYIFAEHLKIMDVPTAHHAAEVVIGALGVWAMYGLAIEIGLTTIIAGATALIYALYPTIADLMRSDAKDAPLVAMIVVTAYFFVKTVNAWQKKLSPRAVWGSGILFAIAFGLAGGTKPTAAVFIPIIVLWVVFASLINKQFRKNLQPLGPFFVMTLSFGVIALATFFLVWPWLWDDPVGKLLAAWEFFRVCGFNMSTLYFGKIYHAGVNLPLEFPFAILLVQSPIELTVLAIIGAVWGIWTTIRNKSIYPGLFLLWFAIAMGRFLVPGVLIYARTRHFIDAIPAYIILAAYGAQAIFMTFKRTGKYLAFGILGIIIVHQIIISVVYFPYEYSYFNAIVGGAKRVSQKRLFDIGPSSGVKEAMEAIAIDSGGKPVLVYPCVMGHVAASYTTLNMKLTSDTTQGNYTFTPNAASWFEGAMDFNRDNHKLIYTIRRAGGDIFSVYKYTTPVGWRCGWETRSHYDY